MSRFERSCEQGSARPREPACEPSLHGDVGEGSSRHDCGGTKKGAPRAASLRSDKRSATQRGSSGGAQRGASARARLPSRSLYCEDLDVLGTKFFAYDFVPGRFFSDQYLSAVR